MQYIATAVNGVDYDVRNVADAFFRSAQAQGREPAKSLRFYPKPYRAYLTQWLSAVEATIAGLQPRVEKLPRKEEPRKGKAEKQGRPGKPKAGGTHGARKPQEKKITENATYFKELGGKTDEGRIRFFKEDQHAENLMFDTAKFAIACISARLLPLVDMCCDLLGSNAHCPFFLSAAHDSSTFNLDEWDVWCNPPFKAHEQFVDNISKRVPNGTRAILLLPDNGSADQRIKGLQQNVYWASVHAFSMSAEDVFTFAKPGLTFDATRGVYKHPVQGLHLFRTSLPGENLLGA